MKKIISFDKEILFPTMIGEITAISLDQTLKFLSKNDIEGNFIISGRYKMTEASAIEEDFEYKLPIEITLAETFTLDTTKIEIKDFYYEIIDEEILKVKIDIQIEGVEEVLLEEEKEEVREKPKEEVRAIKEKEEAIKNVELEDKEPLPNLEIVEPVIEKEPEEVRECDSEEKSMEERKEDVEPLLKETEKQVALSKEITEQEPKRKEEKVEVEEQEEMKQEPKQEIEHPVIKEEQTKIEKKETKEEVSKVELKEENHANIQSIFRVFNEAEETYKAYTVYIMRKNDSINTVLDRYDITKEQLEEYNDLSKIELGSKVIIPTTND